MKITVKDMIDELENLDRLIWLGEKEQASNEVHAIHEGLLEVVTQEHGMASESACENTLFRCHEDFDEPCDECED